MHANAIDADGKWLYRVGGIAAVILGVAYLVIIGLYVPMGAPPSGAEEQLKYIAAHTTAWWLILALSVLTDLLFVPLAFALYLALKGLNRNVMLLATACVGLFVVLDLAITWTNYAGLISLSGNYAAATNDAQRAVIVTAATFPTAILESTLLFVYNTLTLSLGILMTGLVMLKASFGKSAAWLGVVTGSLGVVAVVGPLLVSVLSFTILFASLLTTLWVLLVGYKLYRLGQ